MNKLFVFMLLFVFASCGTKDKDYDKEARVTEITPLYSEKQIVLDHVFIDRYKVLHMSRRCSILKEQETYNGRYYDTEHLADMNIKYVCSQCVNYETYKELRACGFIKDE